MDVYEDGTGGEQGIFLPVFDVDILDFDAFGELYEDLADGDAGFELPG